MIDRRLALILALGLVGCEEGAPPDPSASPPIEQPYPGGAGGVEGPGPGGVEDPGGGGVEDPGAGGVEDPGAGGVEDPGAGGMEDPGAGGAGGAEMPLGCVDPGRVTLRRLNRVEYDNTMRDLLGDDSRPAQAFPEDDIGYGFDNIGDVLSISPLHLEQYEHAARELVERAVDAPVVRTEVVFEAEDVGSDVGGAFRGDYWNLWSNGSIDAAVVLPAGGEYLIRVAAFGQQAGDALPQMTVSLDQQVIETFDVANVDAPEWYEVSVVAPAGGHTVSVAFINDFFDAENPDRAQRDRNLIVDAIIVDGPIGGAAVEAAEQVFEAEEVGADRGAASGDAWNLWSNGTMSVDLNLPVGGEYDLRVRAWGQQAGPDLARMTLSLDGAQLELFEVAATAGAPAWYEHRVAIAAGAHTIDVAFINDYYDPENPDPAQRDRNLLLDVLIVHGPFNVEAPDPEVPAEPAADNPLFVCQPVDQDDLDCAGQIVGAFAARAWRRPLEDGELERLMALVRLAREQNDPLVEGIRLAMRGVLLSPHFLYKVELDPDPHSLEPHRLTEHELATRLSYFVWSTMPDARLRELADAGRLSDPEVLDAEVQRMLADPKAEALVDNFAGQWLFVRAMNDVAPDYNYFPDFDDLLRGAMIVEALAFFRRFLADDRPVPDLLDYETTFLNPRLAAHYGVDFEAGVESPDAPPGFRAFDLSGTDRGGLLTLGSTLTVTSFPTRTSPVKRGKWVLEQLMCDEPPAPPPGVEAELGEVDQAASLRERLAQHRENPECAVCHNRMDPIGLGLENFDAIGAFRDMEGEHPIDSSGELPDGSQFVGAQALAGILKADARFKSCFQDQLTTYALGTGVERRDAYACLDAMAEDFEAEGWRMQSVIGRLVHSPMFTMRRGEPELMEGE